MLCLKETQKYILILMFFLIIILPSKIDADEKNINRLLNNQAVVSRQIMCILEKSPCDQLGRQLKGTFILYVYINKQSHFFTTNLLPILIFICIRCYSKDHSSSRNFLFFFFNV